MGGQKCVDGRHCLTAPTSQRSFLSSPHPLPPPLSTQVHIPWTVRPSEPGVVRVPAWPGLLKEEAVEWAQFPSGDPHGAHWTFLTPALGPCAPRSQASLSPACSPSPLQIHSQNFTLGKNFIIQVMYVCCEQIRKCRFAVYL